MTKQMRKRNYYMKKRLFGPFFGFGSFLNPSLWKNAVELVYFFLAWSFKRLVMIFDDLFRISKQCSAESIGIFFPSKAECDCRVSANIGSPPFPRAVFPAYAESSLNPYLLKALSVVHLVQRGVRRKPFLEGGNQIVGSASSGFADVSFDKDFTIFPVTICFPVTIIILVVRLCL